MELGDERGFYTVILTKNRKKIKSLGCKQWKTNAYEIYNNAIEKNRAEVRFPLKYRDTHKTKIIPTKYEILLIKKINEGEDNVAQFRNETGKYVENVIEDDPCHVILAKEEWYVEETFKVYGYHPIKDRKTFGFILDEMIIGSVKTKYDITSIFTYKNKLILSYLDDFDFITCRNAEETQRLFMQLQKQLPKEYKKNVLFLGKINNSRISTIIDSLQEKTGLPRNLMRKSSS